jgi:GntR family transcriptional regulator/MocR family aminotransferase
MLAPSLRQGWLVLPPTLASAVAQAKVSADRGSPALEQLALAAFLDAGDLDRHLRRTRAIYRRRRDLLLAALRACIPDAGVRGVAAGLHLYLSLPDGVDEEALVADAAAAAIRVCPASQFHSNPGRAQAALLLGYGGIDEAKIEPGVRRLAELIRIRPAGRASIAPKGTGFRRSR